MRNKQLDKACDKAIIDLAKGDKNALSVIYDCMARRVFSIAYGITGTVYDAEDVLQNTMIEISKYAHTYQAGSNAKAWILTIAHHGAINIVRKRKPMVSMENEKMSDLFETESDFTRIHVLEMLSILDPEEKQVLIYRLYAGMPYKHIAGMMGISVASAQKKYQRAVKKLKSV